MSKQVVTPKSRSLKTIVQFILLIGGILGIIASFILSYDSYQLAKDPSFQPNCNLNPIISCGGAMASSQGEIFGFPNPWLGMLAFAALTAFSFVLFASTQALKRWFWLTLQVGATLGVLAIHWLLYESLYQIHSLCPYCMSVWIITITIFWYVTLYNLETGVIRLPAQYAAIGRFIRQHHLDILIAWLLILFVVIVSHFWYYFGAQLGF